MLALDNLKSIFKVLPISSVITLPNVPDFSTLYVNDAFLNITADFNADFINNGLFEILPNLSFELTEKSQLIISSLNEVLISKASQQFSISEWKITITPIMDEDNVIVYLVHTFERTHLQREINDALPPPTEKYEDLFNLSPLPHWVYSVDTLRFLDVNAAAIKHYGYSKEEFLSMTLIDIRPAEDISILEEILSENIEKGVYHRSLVRHQKKNGDIISVQVEGNTICFQRQNARLVLAIDHTEKIKAEKALAASERRFKALIQEGSDLIAILDKDGYYRYVNPTAKTILGMEIDFFIGKNAMDFVHKEDRDKITEQMKLLGINQRIRISPYRFSIGNGQYCWLETTITNLTNDPDICGFVANSRDVTKQIGYELKMEDSIARFAIVSKATSDAIWDRDILSNKVTWNKGLKGIFGHNKLHSTHKWWHSHVHPEDVDQVVKKVQLLIKNKESRLTVEYRFKCADGTYKYINDRAFLLFDQNGEAVRMIGSMQDITDRVNYIKAMENQNDRLRDISWMQSHHVRAPLARILGLTSLLSVDNNSREETREFLQHLSNSSVELDRIIREIVKKTEGF